MPSSAAAPSTDDEESAGPFPARLRRGLDEAHRGELRALQTLAAEFDDCGAAGDRRGRLLAGAALILAGQVAGNYRHFAAAIEALQPLRDGTAGPLTRNETLLAHAGLLGGLLFYHPNDPFIDACALRVVEALHGEVDVNLKFAAARLVLYYIEPREKRELGQLVYGLVQPDATHPALTPHRLGHWLIFWRRCASYAKEGLQSRQAEAQARALAERHGLRDIRFLLAIEEVDRSLPQGDVALAQAAIDRAEALVEPARLREMMLLEISKTRLARMRSRPDEALFHASRALGYATELQVPPAMRAVYLVNEAQARLMVDDFDGALAGMREALPLVHAGYVREIEAMLALVGAYDAVRRAAPARREAARERLAAVWAGLRERQFYDCFEGYPEFAARLCVQALELDVEPEFVRTMIEKTRLAAPPDAPQGWPWPLRIHALGLFSVQRHGQVLASEGKSQKKPLELLKAVIAHGATQEGRGVEVGTLIDELWPDVEASDPKASFEVALSRLRKWLGVEGVLKLSDGRLALNAALVWCDSAAFERCFDAVMRHVEPHADATPLPGLVARLTALYRGPLFGSGRAEAWSVAPRERLALKFTRAVTEVGRHLETMQDWAGAIRLYELGLAQDPLAEPIHRALMRCHLALGQRADAARAWARCREVLAARLRVEPAAETVELARRIDAA